VARLGIIVAKKKVKTAVARHRIKRLVRESFRQARQSLPDIDVIVLARQGIEKKSNQTIFNELDKHWRYLKSNA